MKHLQVISTSGLRGSLLRCPIALASLSLATLLAFVGCASTAEQSAAMVDPDVDFNNFKTFSWQEDPVRDPDSQPLTLVENAIRSAIAAEMGAKGYEEARTGRPADLLISYQAARTETVKSSPFRFGIGVGSYGSGGGASVGTSTSGVKNVTEGSLTIHAIDAERNAEVWQSDVTRELKGGNVDTEIIKSAVAEVFAEFPATGVAQ